jgi:hypothetical protein
LYTAITEFQEMALARHKFEQMTKEERAKIQKNKPYHPAHNTESSVFSNIAEYNTAPTNPVVIEVVPEPNVVPEPVIFIEHELPTT